jgi:hypothetical protein
LESGSVDTSAQQETVVTTPATPVSETVMGLATEAGDTGVMPINEKTNQHHAAAVPILENLKILVGYLNRQVCLPLYQAMAIKRGLGKFI